MPAALIPRDEVVARLTLAFRTHGYDGASLAELAAATGLHKSSLYHYFPDGKAQMAAEVLAALAAELERDLFAPLAPPRGIGGPPPHHQLARMLAALDAFYAGGTRACLLERLGASTEASRALRRPLAAAFTRWIDALAGLARAAGLPPKLARTRAEDTVARVEGALVIAGATGDASIFARTLRTIDGTFFAR